MSISNRVTLEQAMVMPVQELAKLPVEQIHLLLWDVTALKAHAKSAEDRIFSVLDTRYRDAAAKERQNADKDTGTVRFKDEGFVVVADLPKKVSWSEAGLAEVERKLVEMGEPPADYIKVRRDVPEAKYGSWPASLQKLFEPHRTVGVGKAAYKIESIPPWKAGA